MSVYVIMLLVAVDTCDTGANFCYILKMASGKLFNCKSLQDVKAALKAGADINVQRQYQTPLLRALYCCSQSDVRDVVEYLINKGANVQAVTIRRNGYLTIRSPLVSSLNISLYPNTKDNAYQIVEMLLEHGANPNQADRDFACTPLTLALSLKNEEFVPLLIKHGADVNMKDNTGRLPLAMALKLENIDLIKLFLNEGAEFSVQKVFPESIKLENLDILQMLIERGANLNLKSLNGETPLTCALKVRNPEIVQLLIDCGADVNLPDASGDAPLTQAIKMGFLKMVELLIQKGADVSRDDPIKTALDVRPLLIVKCLIEAGADFNVVGSDGRSPLTAAVEEYHFDLIRLLLDRGADVNQRDGNQKSPFSVAVAVKNLRFAKYLQERGAKVDESLSEIEEMVKQDEDWAHHFADLF